MRSIVLVAILLAVSALGAAQWPSYQHDERNSGFLPGGHEPYKAVWWDRALPADATNKGPLQVDASPVVMGGTLVVADWHKRLWALEADTGREIWNYTFPDRIQSTPAIADNSVYAVDVKGNLKQLSLKTGALLDELKIGSTHAPITVHQGKLYIGDEAGTMWAVFLNGLNVNWKFDTASVRTGFTSKEGGTSCGAQVAKGPIQGAAAVFEGRVFFGARNNYMYAVNEGGNGDGTTTPQWFYKTEDAILGGPAIDKERGLVIFGSFDRYIHAVSSDYEGDFHEQCKVPAENRRVWRFEIPEEGEGLDSRVQGTPVVVGDRVFVAALNGYVYALETHGGRPEWAGTGGFHTGDAISSSPAAAQDILVVANDAGRVVWLDTEDGSIITDYQSGVPMKASPAISKERTYLAGFDGAITMLASTTPMFPDLRIDFISWGDQNLTVSIRNGGKADAPAGLVRLDLNGTLLAQLEFRAIASGATTELVHVIRDAPSTFVLNASVDPTDEITEEDEANNFYTATFEPEVIELPTEPDGNGSGESNPPGNPDGSDAGPTGSDGDPDSGDGEATGDSGPEPTSKGEEKGTPAAVPMAFAVLLVLLARRSRR